MLTELYIKNLAIVDEVRLSFQEGINVLTGETGTGKSIIINSIGLICGARANASLVGKRENMAFVEGAFFLDEFEKELLKEKIELLNLDIDVDDDLLVVSRSISRNGRSVSRINNRIVNNVILSEIMLNVINICGQHDSYTLFNKTNFVDLLDSFCSDEFSLKLAELKNLYLEIKSTNLNVKNLTKKVENLDEKLDVLIDELNELDSLNLETLDEKNLESELERIDANRDIYNTCLSIDELFSSENNENNILSRLSSVSNEFLKIEQLDSNFKLLDEFEDYFSKIREIYEKFKNYQFGLNIDEDKYENLQYKFDLLNEYKYKYKKNKDELFLYKKELEEELYLLENSNDILKKEAVKLKKLKEDYISLAEKISKIRVETASKLEKLIENELIDLDLKNVTFKINVDSTIRISSSGFDDVKFLISTNKGEPLNEISKIASGGELSRILLGFKKVLSDRDKIGTLVFDEIDAGISGITAQIVGEKLVDISKSHQLIVISHLPQISVLSDNHFIIQKNTVGDETISTVINADEDEKTMEISRIIGGANINEITIKQSKEMIRLADILKEKVRNE